MGVRVKSYHSSGIRVFVQDAILYERLEDHIRTLYKLNKAPLALFYRDDEQDWVRFSSDRELKEATNSLSSGQYFRVKVQPADATFPLAQDPLAQEQILQMARDLFAQPGSFPRLVQTLLPSVVEHLQASGEAPQFVVPSTRREPDFDCPLFAEEKAEREKRDAKEMLQAFRSQMGALDLVCPDPGLLRSYIEPAAPPPEGELQESQDSLTMDEDSFVMIDQPESVEMRSMSDVFVSFGFTDRDTNEQVIRECHGSFEKALNMLIAMNSNNSVNCL